MLSQQLFIVRIAGDGIVILEVILRQQFLHLLGQNVAHGDDIQLVIQRGLDVVDRDAAAADQRVGHGKGHSFFVVFYSIKRRNFLANGAIWFRTE